MNEIEKRTLQDSNLGPLLFSYQLTLDSQVYDPFIHPFSTSSKKRHETKSGNKINKIKVLQLKQLNQQSQLKQQSPNFQKTKGRDAVKNSEDGAIMLKAEKKGSKNTLSSCQYKYSNDCSPSNTNLRIHSYELKQDRNISNVSRESSTGVCYGKISKSQLKVNEKQRELFSRCSVGSRISESAPVSTSPSQDKITPSHSNLNMNADIHSHLNHSPSSNPNTSQNQNANQNTAKFCREYEEECKSAHNHSAHSNTKNGNSHPVTLEGALAHGECTVNEIYNTNIYISGTRCNSDLHNNVNHVSHVAHASHGNNGLHVHHKSNHSDLGIKIQTPLGKYSRFNNFTKINRINRIRLNQINKHNNKIKNRRRQNNSMNINGKEKNKSFSIVSSHISNFNLRNPDQTPSNQRDGEKVNAKELESKDDAAFIQNRSYCNQNRPATSKSYAKPTCKRFYFQNPNSIELLNTPKITQNKKAFVDLSAASVVQNKDTLEFMSKNEDEFVDYFALEKRKSDSISFENNQINLEKELSFDWDLNKKEKDHEKNAVAKSNPHRNRKYLSSKETERPSTSESVFGKIFSSGNDIVTDLDLQRKTIDSSSRKINPQRKNAFPIRIHSRLKPYKISTQLSKCARFQQIPNSHATPVNENHKSENPNSALKSK